MARGVLRLHRMPCCEWPCRSEFPWDTKKIMQRPLSPFCYDHLLPEGMGPGRPLIEEDVPD